MTFWPKALDKGSASARAVRSGLEPAGKPTTKRTVCVGHAAADPVVDGLAHEGVIPKAKAALMASVRWRREKPVWVRAVMVDAFKTKLQ
jgi:hypothetical protein